VGTGGGALTLPLPVLITLPTRVLLPVRRTDALPPATIPSPEVPVTWLSTRSTSELPPAETPTAATMVHRTHVTWQLPPATMPVDDVMSVAEISSLPPHTRLPPLLQPPPMGPKPLGPPRVAPPRLLVNQVMPLTSAMMQMGMMAMSRRKPAHPAAVTTAVEVPYDCPGGTTTNCGGTAPP